MKEKNPNIRIVYLTPIAHPDKQNMSSSQQNEYTADISRHQQKLEEYYNSLGFTLYTYVVQDEGETDYYRFFEGNIDYIIETIDNFEKMRQFNFNSYVDPRIEIQMMEQFGIETTTRESGNMKNGSSKYKNKSKKTESIKEEPLSEEGKITTKRPNIGSDNPTTLQCALVFSITKYITTI